MVTSFYSLFILMYHTEIPRPIISNDEIVINVTWFRLRVYRFHSSKPSNSCFLLHFLHRSMLINLTTTDITMRVLTYTSCTSHRLGFVADSRQVLFQHHFRGFISGDGKYRDTVRWKWRASWADNPHNVTNINQWRVQWHCIPNATHFYLLTLWSVGL